MGDNARRLDWLTTPSRGALLTLVSGSLQFVARFRAWRGLFQMLSTLAATACQIWNLQMPVPAPLTTLTPTLNFACEMTLTLTLSIQTCWG
jgi:hypothetical protein